MQERRRECEALDLLRRENRRHQARQGGSTAYTNDGNSYTIKPFPAKKLKGFGGGDGYASSFIRALLDGCEVIEALEFGSASASMLISAHSCSAAMPSLDAVKKFIADAKAEYGEMVVRA